MVLPLAEEVSLVFVLHLDQKALKHKALPNDFKPETSGPTLKSTFSLCTCLVPPRLPPSSSWMVILSLTIAMASHFVHAKAITGGTGHSCPHTWHDLSHHCNLVLQKFCCHCHVAHWKQKMIRN